MQKIAVYPGTFDPMTRGHVDVIRRALDMFDEVIVGVANSKNKNPMYSVDTRVKMAKAATKHLQGVTVKNFSCLLVDFAKENDAHVIIRGLRAVSDFEFELQMGYANASLWEEIETIYLMPHIKYSFISSSIVRSILIHDGEVKHLVPSEILPFLKEK